MGTPGGLMPSLWSFKKYGQCAMDISELFPQLSQHADDLARRMRQAMDRGREHLPGKSSFEHVLCESRPQVVAERYLAFYREVLASRLARAA